ncbi:hypothetical protein [Pseudofrankia sp. DC12]|uniref:hypothetical protein n=1 Tax=Pseudofrankia sp. DC12 TaxID=683315 RepID=UPI0032D5B053
MTRAHCLRDTHTIASPPRAAAEPPRSAGEPPRTVGDVTTAAGLPRRPVGDHWPGSRPARPPEAGAPAGDAAAADDPADDSDDPTSRPADATPAVIPAEGCVCGLYAWRDPETLAAAPYPRWTRRPIVMGAARLGGRVIVGERGYRAEVGYPVAIHDPHGVIAPAYQVARYRYWSALVAEWLPEAPSAAA